MAGKEPPQGLPAQRDRDPVGTVGREWRAADGFSSPVVPLTRLGRITAASLAGGSAGPRRRSVAEGRCSRCPAFRPGYRRSKF